MCCLLARTARLASHVLVCDGDVTVRKSELHVRGGRTGPSLGQFLQALVVWGALGTQAGPRMSPRGRRHAKPTRGNPLRGLVITCGRRVSFTTRDNVGPQNHVGPDAALRLFSSYV